MNISLKEFFLKLEDKELPAAHSGDLFGFDKDETCIRKYKQADIDFLNSYFTRNFNYSLLEGEAEKLFNISFNAFDIFLNTWLSELPLEREAIRYGKKIIAACQSLNTQEEMRKAADKITANRTDDDTIAILNASGKVGHEIHRMMGLLRFNPNEDGEFIAKCESDHLILPSLGEYFTSRFGNTAWSIIDIKRGLCLRRCPPNRAKTFLIDKGFINNFEKRDEWEELWKHYHKIINNEERNNPGLQRQLMPQRYWKHLPEIK